MYKYLSETQHIDVLDRIQEKITNSGAAVHPKNCKLQIQKKQTKQKISHFSSVS